MCRVTKINKGEITNSILPYIMYDICCLHTELISLSTVVGLIEEFEFFARNELNPKKELEANLGS